MSAPPISFARGAPSLDIVDVEGLREAASAAIAADPAGALLYGTGAGYKPLREWIADRHGVAPEQVIVTNGSMQADALLFSTLVSEGDPVIVELPTYDRTLPWLRDRARAEVHAVPLDDDGISLERLEALLAGGLRPSVAHLIPNFHNPAGCTLSLEKRKRLVAAAEEHGLTIFEDDPYFEIRFEGEPLPSMFSLDRSGSVVYASTFSKTICPGVRVGYLIGPAEVIARVTELATATYISPSMIAQAAVYEFCRSGRLERSIQTVRAALRERSGTLAGCLRRRLPEARFVEPEGGYFLWLELPDTVDVDALFAAAAERGVVFVRGRDFADQGAEHALRLAYSAVTPEQIEEGVSRLADALRSLSPTAVVTS
jgi:DNA-binding transcriptional MocR family regulator